MIDVHQLQVGHWLLHDGRADAVLAMQPFAGGCSDGCHGGQPEGLLFFHFWKAIKMKQYVDLYTPYGDSSSYGEGTKKVPLPVAFHLM